MKKSLLTLSAVVAALFVSQAAFAQDATKSRAEVKKEAASAVKSGEVAKGEGPAKAAPMKSEKARTEVKKEAAAAEKAGTIGKGEGSPNPTADAKSTKARAEVKKDAAAAVKAGEVAKGEGPATTPAKK